MNSLSTTLVCLLSCVCVQLNAATSDASKATIVKTGVYPGHTGELRDGTHYYYDNVPLCLGVNGKDSIVVNTDGSVKIGKTLTVNANTTVSVNTTLYAKEIRVQANPFPDYVFADDYHLLPLPELEAAIKRDRHLPGVPAAAVIAQDGLPVSEIVVKQMEKIEELTLHAIALNKSNLALQAELQRANERLAAIEARLAQQDGR